jgi:hypothetical protein
MLIYKQFSKPSSSSLYPLALKWDLEITSNEFLRLPTKNGIYYRVHIFILFKHLSFSLERKREQWG